MAGVAYSQWGAGIACLLCATLIWAGASVLAQYIFTDLKFHSPFMMTYIANSLFLVYLPLWQLWVWLGIVKKDRNPTFGSLSVLSLRKPFSPAALVAEPASSINSNPIHESSSNDSSSSSSSGSEARGVNGEENQQRAPYTHMHALRAALIITPLYFLANCLYNYSLYMTSVSSSTIISNLAASFTLFFSWYAGLEDITWSKVSGLALCFLGAILVGVNDSESGSGQERSVTGDVVALLAALGYGAYTTLIRLQVPDEETVSVQLVFGYIGLVCFFLLLPVAVVMFALGSTATGGAFGGAQSLTWTALGFIILGGLCDNVFSDYLWARAVVLTSPTVATVGMSITIPFAMLSDFILHKTASTPVLSLCGAALVILGFVLVNCTPDTLIAYATGCLRVLLPAEQHGLLLESRGGGGVVKDSVHGRVSREDYVKRLAGTYRRTRSRDEEGDTDSETGLTE